MPSSAFPCVILSALESFFKTAYRLVGSFFCNEWALLNAPEFPEPCRPFSRVPVALGILIINGFCLLGEMAPVVRLRPCWQRTAVDLLGVMLGMFSDPGDRAQELVSFFEPGRNTDFIPSCLFNVRENNFH